MIYLIISYLRSLVILSFLACLMFVVDTKIKYVNYIDNIETLYQFFIIGFLVLTIFYIIFYKYILMPYSLNLHSIFSHNTFIQVRNKRTLFLDYFWNIRRFKPKNLKEKIYLKDLKKFEIEFKNLVSIDIDMYRNKQENILHFLSLLDKDYQLKVYPIKSKSILLSFFKLPKYYEIEYSFLKKNLLFLGIYENGFFYKNFIELDHHLIVGESGSGKSNLMQLYILNFLFNIHLINKMFFVDLKGGVELKRFENKSNIEFISEIEKLDTYLDLILEELKNTQNEMLIKGIRKLDKYTILVFDEIGAISVYPNKKLRDSIYDKLALISMQGRASGILLFAFAQKIDNSILPSSIVNNLQSRVLLKTSSDYNVNIIDLKENIRKNITHTEIQDFPKGRGIIKDGLTSEKILIHFPFITDNLINQSINIDFSKIN